MPSSKERIVKRRLADGSVREYRYSRGGKRDRTDPGSVTALIAAYRRSPEYAALKPATVRNYGYYLRDLEALGPAPVADVRRRTLLAMRDAIASTRGNGAGNVFAKVCAVLFGWARDRGWIDHSPAERFKALAGGHLEAWTEEEADIAQERLPEFARRAVVLARFTGQRRGDLIRLMWSVYDGSTIRLKQQKTGAELIIPVHPVLKAELDEWKRTAGSTHILTSVSGRPWKANRLSQVLGEELLKIGLRDELNIHGLRKTAAAALADAGCTEHEIGAITGHRSLAMVQLYTRSANQRGLAEAAMGKLERFPSNGKRRRENALETPDKQLKDRA